MPPAIAPRLLALGIKPEDALPTQQRPVLVAAYGDLKRVRAAGRRVIAMTEHGMGQSYSNNHPSYAGGQDHGDVGLFLVPNQHAAGRNRAAYPETPVAVVGCPKLDQLPQREPGELTVAVSFHWDCGVTFETRAAYRVYRYALRYLARRFRVLGHAHPRMLARIRGYYETLGIEVVPDFADVCRRADVYVCDNSSTIYEFAATGRPVVLLNAPYYRKRVRHGLRFWDAAHVGLNVDRANHLVPTVERALADAPKVRRDRENALDIVYAFRTGAARRAADTLVGWAA